jgi:hypothetical protein
MGRGKNGAENGGTCFRWSHRAATGTGSSGPPSPRSCTITDSDPSSFAAHNITHLAAASRAYLIRSWILCRSAAGTAGFIVRC